LWGLLGLAGGEEGKSLVVRVVGRVGPPNATTLAAVLAVGSDAAGIWCGDSRVYLITSNGVDPLTRDHSWAEGVVRAGIMTAEKAAADYRSHMITRWLGIQQEGIPSAETFRLNLKPGDVLLACSDGLYAFVAPPAASPEDLGRALLHAKDDLSARLDRLIDMAMDRGGHDDVTGAAIELLA
ncbi:MAG: PP2C family protein-serine/threonine phosphatase, partial [Chloroflexota bacterium]